MSELLIRLIKLESKLSIRSERQLYIICVILVSDHELEVWWKQQKQYT